MSPRCLVAWGALLVVAVAHPTQLSPMAADVANALSEVATGAMKAFEGVEAMSPRSDAPFSAESDDTVSAEQLALTTNAHRSAANETALREMRRDVASNVAQNEVLMKNLRRGAEAPDKAGEADAVVFSLARAVHSWVLESAAGRDSVYERPAALAALHQWDAVGRFAVSVGRPVPASEVRGVALLLGRPGQKAVDGAAAFAFRALEHVSDTYISLEGHPPRPSLELAVADALKALEAPATSCHNLLLGSGQDTHAAVQAASSEMEWSVCQFVVKAYAALQAAVSNQGSVSFDAAGVAAALLNASDIEVGPVLGQRGVASPDGAGVAAALLNASEIEVGPVLGQRGVASGMAAVGRPVAAFLKFLTSTVKTALKQRIQWLEGAKEKAIKSFDKLPEVARKTALKHRIQWLELAKEKAIKSFDELPEVARNAAERADEGKKKVIYLENELNSAKKEEEKFSLRRTKRNL